MTKTLAFPGLPVEETFPNIKTALKTSKVAILEAPPGAGKTTLVPLALLNEAWLSGQKIIMLEPRRLAARMAASRMASLLGEKLGETVGYRIRQDKKVGPKTRIEVVTEGILTRQLQSDPELDGVGLVIFDEFHERNLQGDLSLAFCLESQSALREDLRLLIMSATLDGEHLSNWLGKAPRITSEGRAYPVSLQNFARPDKFTLAQDVAKAALRALKEETGNILAFLPGEGEIRKTQKILEGKCDAIIAPLYGALPQHQQDIAISPTSKGLRKIVLATTIAETSLTIEGIRVVIDCGLKRVSTFDNARALSKLETVRVSKASATQRMGRAGRMERGVCYQLWPKAETQALIERDRPEILEADLTPFALELASWGVKNPHDLMLLDMPSPRYFKDAQSLLQKLDALDHDLRLTQHGKKILALSLHPRIAHMVLKSNADSPKDGALACEIAAVLHDGPLFKGKRDSDLRSSISLLQSKATGGNISKGALYRAKDTAKSLKRKLKIKDIQSTSYLETGRLLALAYPDRIAKQRIKGSSEYHLSAGMGARLFDQDPMCSEEFIVVAHMDAGVAQGRIFSAAPLSETDIENDFYDLILETNDVGWDKKKQAAIANKVRKLGAITLKSTPLQNIDPELLKLALCKGIKSLGLQVLPWTKESETLCHRIEFLSQHDTWPDMSETGLLHSLEDWLAPFMNSCTRIDHLRKIDLETALLSRLNWEEQQRLNKLAPTHYKVPSGSNIRLDYTSPSKPKLSVKLQEMFGEPQTPTINQGRCALQIHLLSPAGRPLQVTEDLSSFWHEAYDSVKKEMRGRYPKHPWPDNPIDAVATDKTKRHLK